MQNIMGWRKHKYQCRSKNSSSCSCCCPKHSKICGVLCCSSSRLSVSSTTSSATNQCEQLSSMSNFMHAMVQARLDQMIDEQRSNAQRRRGVSFDEAAGRCVILIAVDKRSCHPRRDFRESIQEVITSKGLVEPKELRSLLNCYISLNPRENHQIILEAFHEVCCRLFSNVII